MIPWIRTLVEQLARVNPIHLSCNEKLAFWINLYNALIMHVSFFLFPSNYQEPFWMFLWELWWSFNAGLFGLWCPKKRLEALLLDAKGLHITLVLFLCCLILFLYVLVHRLLILLEGTHTLRRQWSMWYWRWNLLLTGHKLYISLYSSS